MATAFQPSVSSIKVKKEGSSNSTPEVAPFISKVWEIVNDSRFNELVTWSENGKTFIVLNEARFAKEVIPHHFKHDHFSSFVRQLNLYGFRKVAKPDQGALLKTDNNSVEFWHPNFRREHPELLSLMRRPVSTGKNKTDEKNISQVMTEIHTIKGNQSSIENMLEELKQENSHLKQNIALLKEKNKHQDKLLNKIIHFIIHLIYKGTLPTKRSRLMLTDGGIEDLVSYPKRTRLLESPGTPPPSNYSVQSPLPLPIIPHATSSDTVSLPYSSSSYDNNVFPISEETPSLTGVTGDEFLADLLQSPLPPPLSASSTSSLPSYPPLSSYPQQQQQSIVPPPTSSQPPLPSLLQQQELSPPPPSSTVTVVPYQGNKDITPLSLATTQIDSQQQILDSLHEVLPDQFSIDPILLAEFINNSDILPEYDIVDTARILESITTDPHSDVPHEDSVQKTAVVPFTSNMLQLPYSASDGSTIAKQ